jgi:hypothetical protein
MAPAGVGAQGDEDWWEEDIEQRTASVNEGELRFLRQPPEQAVHHHHNHLIIRRSSLDDGWIRMHQCHTHMDPVPSAQVVYNGGRIRRLRITSFKDIRKAWVEEHTVQLRDIGHRARLCIEAESRALQAQGEGRYTLSNGPYMRRFLDGYYPMHVSMDVDYPEPCLRPQGTSPQAQPGLRVAMHPGRISLDAWFEGRLFTQIRFLSARCAGACP